jgi:uncharacterized ferritin-like protein (DUF455 family)
MELRLQALTALCISSPTEKVLAVQALWHEQNKYTITPSLEITSDTSSLLPGRPEKPRLLPPKQVPSRTPYTAKGLATLLHAVCHIEFNAINLALDAVWRFPDMPVQFYFDWLRVAYEESQHFEMLHQHLNSLDYNYGDFDAHDGLWQMCEKTSSDVLARMALVPRTLEARGLDATPLIQEKLRNANTPETLKAVELLDIILRDEVGHVAIGNYWYRFMCEKRQLDPIAEYAQLVTKYQAPKLRPPFNTLAREKAGFSQIELDYLFSA